MVYGFHPATMWLTAGFAEQSASDRLPFGLDRAGRGLLSGLAVPIVGVAMVALEPMQALGFSSADRDEELFVESIEEAHFVFLAGKSTREPAVTHGGFVMTSQAEIADAIRRYQSGEMGKLDSETT